MKNLIEIFKYRQMLYTLVRKDLRTRYKASFLGFLWTFLNPLLMLIVYSIIFPYLLRIKVENYAIFLFVALLPWLYFSTSVLTSSTCIVANSNLVKKIYFPRTIIPLSVAISGLINMFLSYLIVIPVLLITRFFPTVNVLYFPILFAVEFLLVTGFTLFASCLTVYFRDLEHILGVILLAAFYATPVLYNLDMLPEKFQRLSLLNPMSTIVSGFRDIFYYRRAPNLVHLVYVGLFSVVLIVAGIMLFNKLQRRFAEEV